MNGFLWTSLAAVAVVIVFGWRAVESKARYARLVTTETSSTTMIHELCRAAAAAAGPGAFEQRVEVAGTALPGPQGVLTSELAEAECLWHKHKVTRSYRDVDYDRDGNRQEKTRTEEMTGHQTKDPIVVRDGEGEITVIPTATIHGARKTVDEFRQAQGRPQDSPTELRLGRFSFSLPSYGDGGDGDTLGYTYEEWVLPTDAKVFVSGEATDRDGELVIRGPRGADKLIISTRSEEHLTASARSSTRRHQLIAAVAMVAAVGLAVAGFLAL